MTNAYLDYYAKHKISPVKQDISDLDKHFYIRKMLYQSLGVPPEFFKDKDVIEIGPGSGYNSLVTASFNPKHYQLVEANKTGVEDINNLFKKYQLNLNNIDVKNCFIEEFKTNSQFDFAICENMLLGIKNNFEVLGKIDSLVKNGGILILSCSDEISIFYDMTRRLLANILVHKTKVTGFDEKVLLFVEAFESHLRTLKGFNKIPYDWCADNLMGKALYNSSFAISDVLEFLKDRYDFYQMTPNIIVDERWHKEIALKQVEFNNYKKSLFEKTWHNFFHYKVMANEREGHQNIELRKLCRDYFDLIESSEEEYTVEVKNTIQEKLKSIKENLLEVNPILIKSIDEVISFLDSDNITAQSISNDFKYFKSSFGKGLQYLSLIKHVD